MTTDYTPGTVATATVYGVEGVRVMWTDAAPRWWVSERVVGGTTVHYERNVTDICPLVVLDLADLRDSSWTDVVTSLRRHSGCYDIAAQIENQMRLPKLDEPTGLGAVVEDAGGARYVRARTDAHQWRAADVPEHARGLWCSWDDINAVRVLSEGVTE